MSKEYYTKPGMEKYPFSSAVKAGDYIFISGTAANEDDQAVSLEVGDQRLFLGVAKKEEHAGQRPGSG